MHRLPLLHVVRRHLSALAPLLGGALLLTGLFAGVADAVGTSPTGATRVLASTIGNLQTVSPAPPHTVQAAAIRPAHPVVRHTAVRHRAPKRHGHLWVRPDVGPLSSPFGMRWGRMHTGIDLAGPYGSAVRAATDGRVVYVGMESGYGLIILIRDYDGTVTAYAHLSGFLVGNGWRVKAGREIGLEGASGDATGPHLHFEVRVNGRPINPIPFMRNHGVYL